LICFFGGVETTSSTLQYIAFLLGKNPHVQEKLYEEIKDENEQTIEYSKLNKLTYLEWVIKEAMRLYPVTPLNARSTISGTEFYGYQLPPNTTLVMNVWRIHKDSRFWSDPEKFIPERFAEKIIPQHGDLLDLEPDLVLDRGFP